MPAERPPSAVATAATNHYVAQDLSTSSTQPPLSTSSITSPQTSLLQTNLITYGTTPPTMTSSTNPVDLELGLRDPPTLNFPSLHPSNQLDHAFRLSRISTPPTSHIRRRSLALVLHPPPYIPPPPPRSMNSLPPRHLPPPQPPHLRLP
ncbi:hypothetical protein BC829DRAFT_441610 [Chytridium lagenaria]|nr:hypothetical protein BC829DRAFT_441610 [Chytridium lagenaria]